jgi:uncharacterized protein (TIGR02145 family)
MKNIAVLLALFSMTVFAQLKGSFTDSRDGKVYKTVKIGKQTWMAENLNYAVTGSECYNNSISNCNKYGRLYDWETAMKACPRGWHLPSHKEWTALMKFAGGKEKAGTKLKATSGWKDYEGHSLNGTDDYGFAALPGGEGVPYIYQDPPIWGIGRAAYWWSATKCLPVTKQCPDNDHAYNWYISSYYFQNYPKETYRFLFSVRCLKN